MTEEKTRYIGVIADKHIPETRFFLRTLVWQAGSTEAAA